MKQVRVFRLVTENTIDEKIVERAKVKLHLEERVIEQGKWVNISYQMISRVYIFC